MLTFACQNSGELGGDPEFRNTLDSVSYSLGYFYGSSMANEGIDEFNYNNFIAGLKTALDQQEADFDEMEMQMTIQNFQMSLQAQQESERRERAVANREEAERFLQENAARGDVHVTDSGLQYRIVEDADGLSPGPESTVRVHYRGTLLNGEEFDSSYSRGDPAEFEVNRVISGWTEGLQLMNEGATYEFVIPADLGYGDNPPQGSPIEPGSVLIFEVELLSVVEE